MKGPTKNQTSSPHWIAVHAHLMNEFTEDEKCHDLMRWLNCIYFQNCVYLITLLLFFFSEHHKAALLAVKASTPQPSDRIAPPLATSQKANSKQRHSPGLQDDSQSERERTNRLQQTSILQFVRARYGQTVMEFIACISVHILFNFLFLCT